MSDSEIPQLPNPLTPLAWLPPDIASQLEASRYLYNATMGAWIWDVLMSLPEEYRMVSRQGKVTYPDIVYLFARLSSGAFVTTCLVFQVATVGDCHALAKAIGWCAAFALPLNSLLFFFRVAAVFNGNKIITFVFGFLWLATFACALLTPFGVDGTHIGSTGHCVNTNVKPFSSSGSLVVAINDTLVFIAISVKLLKYTMAETWAERIKSFLTGRGMGAVSRMLLQTGQLYYLATVGVNIVAMVVILAPGIPPVVRAMFYIPNVAIQNVMACRVFRLLKLGLLTDDPVVMSRSVTHSQSVRFYHPNSRTFNGSSSILPGQVKPSDGTESIALSPTGEGYHARTGRAMSMHVDIKKETEVVVEGSETEEWKARHIV